MSRINFRTFVLVTSLVALVFSFNLLAGAQDRTTTNPSAQSDKKQQSGSTKQSGTNNQMNNQTGKDNQQGDNRAGQSATSSNAMAESERKFVMETAHHGMAEVMLGRMAAERASNEEVKRFGQRMVDDHTKANQELMQLASMKGITLPAMSDMSGDKTGTASGTGTSMSGTQTTGSGSQTSSSTGQTTGSQSSSSTGQTTGSQTTGSQTAGTPTTGSQASGSQTTGSTTAMSGQGGGAHAAHMSDEKHKKVMDRLSALSGAEFDREYMKQMVKDHNEAVSDFQKQSTRAKDPDIKAFAARTLPTLQEHLRMARELEAKVKGGSNTNTNTKTNNTSGDSNSTSKRP